MNFYEALREQVKVSKSRRGRRLLRRLEGMTPARRRRALARLESHAVTDLKAAGVRGAAVGMDWSEIDWGKLFERLLTLFITLLPLFI